MSDGQPSFPPPPTHHHQHQHQHHGITTATTSVATPQSKVIVKRSVIGTIVTLGYILLVTVFCFITDSPAVILFLLFSLFFFCKCLYRRTALKVILSVLLLLAKSLCFIDMCTNGQIFMFLINLILLLIPSSSCVARWFFPCYTKKPTNSLLIQNQIINIQPAYVHPQQQQQHQFYVPQQHQQQQPQQHYVPQQQQQKEDLPPPYDYKL